MSELQFYGQPQVYIVLLNWNGWQDTIECLESVFRLNYPHFTVIVCDNASSDGSMKKIEGWANGFIAASCDSADLARLTVPPITKPLDFDCILSSGEAAKSRSSSSRLLLIQTGANLGFAGGNNVGIRYALARGDCDYVWLLNNDTVVEPDSLSSMVRMAEADPKLGICGSQLRSYATPMKFKPWGGGGIVAGAAVHGRCGTHYTADFHYTGCARLCGGGLDVDKPEVFGVGGLARRELFPLLRRTRSSGASAACLQFWIFSSECRLP